jgi:hypothetical protein
MRIDGCPRGEKCAYMKWLMAVAFAVAALFLSSLSGGANTNAHAQTTSNTQTTSKTTCTGDSTSAPIEIDILGQSQLGFSHHGDYGLFGFGLVQSLSDMMVNAITGSRKTNTLNDPNQFDEVVYDQGGSTAQGAPCTSVAQKR